MSDADTMEPRLSRRDRLDAATPGTDTVIVACKLPNGLVIYDEREKTVNEQMFGGGFRPIQVWERVPGSEVTLNGNAMSHETLLSGDVPHLVVGGYAMTPGVPRDFWERWLERHRDTDIVRNRLVFAAASESKVRGMAKENAATRSGLEPLDPDHPERSGVRRIERGTRAERA